MGGESGPLDDTLVSSECPWVSAGTVNMPKANHRGLAFSQGCYQATEAVKLQHDVGPLVLSLCFHISHRALLVLRIMHFRYQEP